MKWIAHSAGLFETEPHVICEFGVTESILGASLASIFAGGLEAAGVGAGTAGFLGGVGSGALTGAGLGAGSTLITGGDPGVGALTGALTGGAVGGAGAAGLGTAGQVAAGAAGGALGSEITGGNPLFGAVTGGGAGLVSGLTGASAPANTAITATPSTGAAGGTSAASQAGGISVPSGSTAPMDLTAGGGDFVSNLFGGGGDGIRNPAGMSSLPGGGLSPTGLPMTSDAGVADATRSGGLLPKLGIGGNAGQLLGVAGLGATLLRGPQDVPGEAALNRQAGEAATMGRTLEAYQQSGTLPSGLQTLVDNQTSAAEAQTRSKFAELGLSGSTQEVQALSSLKQAKASEVATIADKLASQGLNWSNLSGQELAQVIRAQQTADANFQNAIMGFARGLAGGGITTNNSSNTG